MTPALVRPIPRLARPGTAAAFLTVLGSQLGYREGEDNDTVFGHEYGMNHAAWCAIFQRWGAVHSGCGLIIPKFAFTPSGATWYRDRDRFGRRPRVGSLGFVYGPAPGGPRIHHVFAVKALEGRYVITLEGNTNNTGAASGNGVYSLRRRADLGPNGGYGYPAFKPGPKPTWRVGDGFPGTQAFRVGHAHPAVPVVRRRLLAVGFGRSRSTDPTWTEQDQVHTAAYQRARVDLRDDADGVLGPQGWRDLLQDYLKARR